MGEARAANVAWELKPVLYSILKNVYGIHLRSIDQVPDMRSFGHVVRGLVERKETKALPAMGGAKYWAFKVDHVALIDDLETTLKDMIKDIVLGCRASYWTDYLMNMWGYGAIRKKDQVPGEAG